MRRNANRVSQQKSELFATDEYRLLRDVCLYLSSLIRRSFMARPEETFLTMGVRCVCGKYKGPNFSGIRCEKCQEHVETRYGDEPSAAKSLEEVLTRFDLSYQSDHGLLFREVIWWGIKEISGMVESQSGFVILDTFALNTAYELVLPTWMRGGR